MNSVNNMTENPFDELALRYDTEFTHTWTGRMQRNIVWKYLEDKVRLSNSASVLELNCGTGEDAFYLSGKGYKVMATDISDEMIRIAKQKNNETDVMKPEFEVCDMRSVPSRYRNRQFDLVFSDFGGFNCLSPEEIKDLSTGLYNLLKPGGRMIIVAMGRRCLWERLYFLYKRKPAEATRRLKKGPVSVKLGNRYQETWYYSPGELHKILDDQFELVQVRPVGISLLPSYLDRSLHDKKAIKTVLTTVEKALGRFSILADHADHFLIDLRKQVA